MRIGLPWLNIIAGLCSRSTLGQTSLQDFACDPPLGKHHCKTLLSIHPWANIIARLCLQNTLGQTSLQDIACNPLLGKHHCRTLFATHPWANIIAGLCSRSTFWQTSLQDFARDLLLVNVIYPWLIRDLPVYLCTLSFFCSRWASLFCLNLVVVTKLSWLQSNGINKYLNALNFVRKVVNSFKSLDILIWEKV